MAELLLLLPVIIQLLLPLLQPSTTPTTPPTLTAPFIPRVPPQPAIARPSYYRPYWQDYHWHNYRNPYLGLGFIPGLFRSGNDGIRVGKGKAKEITNRLLARIPDIRGLLTKPQNPTKVQKMSTLTRKGKMQDGEKVTLARVPDIKSLFAKSREEVSYPKPTSNRKSPEQVKKKLYRRLPVPGTNKYVTIQTKDLMEYVTIFYNKKRFTIKTKDIIGMKTISDMIKKIQG